ncbi:MAG: glycoside hydrolase family 3 N-terminal domain-containing protein [Anaerolineales bacterium]
MKHGLMATAKHFVGYSLSSGGMNRVPIQAGPRFLHETYRMPFQGTVAEAGVRSVVNAYNELDGEVVAASREILTDLLRGELDCKGFELNLFENTFADEQTAEVSFKTPA